MKRFTDLFINRPVLSIAISVLILVLGLRAVDTLPVQQFPKMENATITVTTIYSGAAPSTIAGFITTPIEQAVAQINGIDYMTSTSQIGVSTIILNLRLNYNANEALTEVTTKVNSILSQLPSGTQQPIISLALGQDVDALYVGFRSNVLNANQITDYITRVVQPDLQSVPGVQTAEILGGEKYAMRVWLNPQKLAAYGLTPTDVWNALAANDFITTLGNTKGTMTQVTLNASTDLHTVAQFRQLVIKQLNGSIIRLGDVAQVELGSDSYDQHVTFDNKPGVYVGIKVAPSANLLSVIKGVRARMPQIEANLPTGLEGSIVYDSSNFVKASIREVIESLVEALFVVTFVVFAFLGSPRSVLIPVVAIPLSLIGAFAMMAAFGFSINLLTLLALVLAIGLVVDDAIIVVENVNRHLDLGSGPMEAAKAAAAELGAPIVAMTVVLIAVYVPIAFQSGLTGALFTEFALTLAGSVTISGIVALTLTPMLSSRFLKHIDRERPDWEGKMINFVDAVFNRLHRLYTRLLHASLDTLPVTIIFAAIVLGSIYFLASHSAKELAPTEDQGVVLFSSTSAPNATIGQRAIWDSTLDAAILKYPDVAHAFQIDSSGVNILGAVLKPWGQRRPAGVLSGLMQGTASEVDAGQQVVAFSIPPLPGSSGLPIQFVIKSTNTATSLYPGSQALLRAALKSGKFIFLMSDLKVDQPEVTVEIDRDKAAMLGLNMQDIGAALGQALGGGYVNYFDLDGRPYQVIPQTNRLARLNVADLRNYYVLSKNGVNVPLSAIATLKQSVIPETINHFQQQNSATLSGVAAPGVSTAEALKTLQSLATQILPAEDTVDYAGATRQFVQASNSFIITFCFALIIIFLALAALFNSFRDPLIILVSVPMSIAGALIFIYIGVGGLSLNIYTEVGLVTLMGLVSKHGILIVEVANEARSHRGMSKREAVEYAANIRLRPILMTTAAMVVGVMPLIFAVGAGAGSRFAMGMVIATGLSIGTLFTLFVVPAVYMLISGKHEQMGAQGADAPPL